MRMSEDGTLAAPHGHHGTVRSNSDGAFGTFVLEGFGVAAS